MDLAASLASQLVPLLVMCGFPLGRSNPVQDTVVLLRSINSIA